MSRTFDPKLSGWVDNLKDKDDFKFVEFYYNRGPLGRDIYRLVRYAICGQFGYYAIFNEALITSIHGQLGRWSKGLKFVKETIAYLGELGILDKSLLKHNILTSADIQESWLKAKQAKRAAIPQSLEYWLLGNIPSDKDNNCSNNDYNCSIYTDNNHKKADNCNIDKDIDSDKLVKQLTNKDRVNKVKYTYVGAEQYDCSQSTEYISMKCKDGDFIVTEELKNKLVNDYKDINIDVELKKMQNWLLVNSNRRKYVKGMPRFIVGWLNNSCNSNHKKSTPMAENYPARNYSKETLSQLFVDINDLDINEV